MTTAAQVESLTYEFHPIANIFPMLSPERLKELTEDIVQHGLHDPIMLFEGQILDGRNRACACVEADISPDYIEFDGTPHEALDWVISHNLMRRDLDQGQHAMCFQSAYAYRLNLDPDEKFSSATAPPEGTPNRTAKMMAAEVGVNDRYLQYADRVAKEAPTLVAAVRDGVIPLYVAHEAVAKGVGTELAAKLNEASTTIHSAQEKATRKEARALTAQLVVEKEAAGWTPTPPNSNQTNGTSSDLPICTHPRADLRRGPFQDVLADVADNSVDLVLTDPPWYPACMELWEPLAAFMARVLKPGGFAVIHTGHMAFDEILAILCDEPKLQFDTVITIDFIGTHSQYKLAHARLMVDDGEQVVVMFNKESNQDRPWRRIQTRYTTASATPEKEHHPWQKGVGEHIDIIQTLTDAGALVCDPFLGGGTFAEAALKAGARIVGSEIDPVAYTATVNRVNALP